MIFGKGDMHLINEACVCSIHNSAKIRHSLCIFFTFLLFSKNLESMKLKISISFPHDDALLNMQDGVFCMHDLCIFWFFCLKTGKIVAANLSTGVLSCFFVIRVWSQKITSLWSFISLIGTHQLQWCIPSINKDIAYSLKKIEKVSQICYNKYYHLNVTS